jgi:hypothetical protein
LHVLLHYYRVCICPVRSTVPLTSAYAVLTGPRALTTLVLATRGWSSGRLSRRLSLGPCFNVVFPVEPRRNSPTVHRGSPTSHVRTGYPVTDSPALQKLQNRTGRVRPHQYQAGSCPPLRLGRAPSPSCPRPCPAPALLLPTSGLSPTLSSLWCLRPYPSVAPPNSRLLRRTLILHLLSSSPGLSLILSSFLHPHLPS